jgi:hypothetical protein
LSSRALISDGPPRSFAHAGANPNRARTASRLPSSPRTTASTDWVGAMFARPSARSATAGEIVISNRCAMTCGSRAVLV